MTTARTPEQFIAQSPIGERPSKEVLYRHLAEGASRFIEISGEAQSLCKLGNNGAEVAEVRGIKPGQEVEPAMLDIKVENMEHLTEIDERVKAGGELTADDIVFLRFSDTTEGLGRDANRRIGELLKNRSFDDDLRIAIQGCPTDLANALIDNDGSYVVAENLGTFLNAGADIDPARLANMLIYIYGPRPAAENLGTLLDAGVNPTDLANALIDNDGGYVVADNLKAFLNARANIDLIKLANRLIDSYGPYYASRNLGRFLNAGANPTDLADAFIDNDGGDFVVMNLDRFLDAGVNPTDLANRLISAGYGGTVARNIEALIAAGVDRGYLEAILKTPE